MNRRNRPRPEARFIENPRTRTETDIADRYNARMLIGRENEDDMEQFLEELEVQEEIALAGLDAGRARLAEAKDQKEAAERYYEL